MLFGSSENTIFDPSSGGIGIKLNTASPMFNVAKIKKKYKRPSKKMFNSIGSDPNKKNIAIATNASSKFESGPASATKDSPSFLRRK